MPWAAVGAVGAAVVTGAMQDDNGGGYDPYASTASKINEEQWDRYKKIVFPIEDQVAKEIGTLGGADDIAREEGLASADVSSNFNALRKNRMEGLRQMGSNPGSPQYQHELNSIGISEAGARAGATTSARNLTKQLGLSRRMDFLNMKAGIPSQSSSGLLGAARLNQANIQADWARNRAEAQDIGYLMAPAYKAAGDWLKGRFTNPGWGSPEGVKSAGEAYAGMDIPNSGQYMRGGVSGFKRGGKIGLRKPVTVDGDGMVIGPGTETSDSVPAIVDGQEPVALSSGEQVVNAEAVRIVGREFLDAINKIGLMRRYAREQGPAMARGGRVGLQRRRIC